MKPGRMHERLCDGMPTYGGCSEILYTSVKVVRPGLKKSGWYFCWALHGIDGPEDRSYLCAFCPSCAEIVLQNERN